MNRFKLIISLCLTLSAMQFIAGCDSSGSGPDPKIEAARLESATKLRGFFTKANGNYASLSEADKADYIKLCGGDAQKAETMWNQMKYGPGGGPSSAATKASGSVGS